MADQPEIKPADTKAAAIKAWNDAADVAEKTAAVKQFPILVELYALAANLITE